LADKFIDNGFSVFMPHLFGPIGKTNVAGNLARVFCMRKEFNLFAKNRTSPITTWLRALCRSIKEQENANGVGVIGMCLTGNFAISLMGDDSVLAAVASQPAMPFMAPASLHMSERDIAEIKANIDATAPMKAFQFENDILSTGSKFRCIDETFNTDRQRIELTRLPGKKHSVLTLDFVDEDGHPTHCALTEILTYFDRQLKPS
jgi:dienelactone hydrolase